MYSWGESYDDFRLRKSGKYSFKDARRAYDPVRTPRRAVASGLTDNKWDEGDILHTFRDGDIVTESPYPLVVAIDTTGSMGEWPKVFFEKLPLLYAEAQKYFQGCAISFQAVNDYYADGAAACFQPTPFGEGPELDKLLKELCPIGGGGCQSTESYEVAAAWNVVRLKTPKALIKPVVIFLGDEAPFREVPQGVADALELSSLKTKDVFSALHAKAEVFLIRKPYRGAGSTADRRVIREWTKQALMPSERILKLMDPRRVVDVILGILAALSSKESYFEKELTTRQTRAQSRTVMQALRAFFFGDAAIKDSTSLRNSIQPNFTSRDRDTKDLAK